MDNFIIEFLSNHGVIANIMLIFAWIFFLKKPSDEVRERQMKAWGVYGYRVWGKLMTFQNSINPKHPSTLSSRIFIGIVTNVLVFGSIYAFIMNILEII